MANAAIDHATGSLTLDGTKVFPLILSDGPPRGGKTPENADAWAAIAQNGRGANFLRTGRTLAAPWILPDIDAQIADELATMDAAHAHGLYCWPRLVNAADLPASTNSEPEQILDQKTPPLCPLSALVEAATEAHHVLADDKEADDRPEGDIPTRLLVRRRHRSPF